MDNIFVCALLCFALIQTPLNCGAQTVFSKKTTSPTENSFIEMIKKIKNNPEDLQSIEGVQNLTKFELKATNSDETINGTTFFQLQDKVFYSVTRATYAIGKINNEKRFSSISMKIDLQQMCLTRDILESNFGRARLGIPIHDQVGDSANFDPSGIFYSLNYAVNFQNNRDMDFHFSMTPSDCAEIIGFRFQQKD